jgi:hypothetical protein
LVDTEDEAMPLLDHFHAPLHPIHHWESFHSNWATRLADALNACLPPEFMAEEHTHAGSNLEIDVATLERADMDARRNGGVLTATSKVLYTPPAPPLTLPAVFPDSFEVRVFSTTEGLTLVAAIELVSPGNKDRSDERLAFTTKIASYLYRGIAVIVVDIVTNRRSNLHNETMRLMQADAVTLLPADAHLYAIAYRPVLRDEKPLIDAWPVRLALGEPLPTLPLRLVGDLIVPVDFETAYEEACRRRRIGS